MIEDILKDAEKRMVKSIDALKTELAKLRTGRAHPSLLDHVVVPYYGSDTPLSQVANVSIADARTLQVVPWEKDMVAPIEKAIMMSDLGLNPSSAGTTIRVPMPILTEERRKELIRVVRQESENGRIAIRNIRRDINAQIKELLKEKMISEDESHKSEERAQQLTDRYVKEVDALLAEKEKSLLEI